MRHDIEGYSLIDTPGHLIRRAQQRAVDLYVEEVGEDGLTPRQFALLVTVQQNPGLIQTDLVTLTGIDRSTVADMVRRLIARELLERRELARDRRCNALWITPTGADAVAGSFDGVARAQDRILAPIAPELRDQVIGYLKLLAELPPAAGVPDRAPSRRALAKDEEAVATNP